MSDKSIPTHAFPGMALRSNLIDARRGVLGSTIWANSTTKEERLKVRRKELEDAVDQAREFLRTTDDTALAEELRISEQVLNALPPDDERAVKRP
jgi:hypothetical protein